MGRSWRGEIHFQILIAVGAELVEVLSVARKDARRGKLGLLFGQDAGLGTETTILLEDYVIEKCLGAAAKIGSGNCSDLLRGVRGQDGDAFDRTDEIFLPDRD